MDAKIKQKWVSALRSGDYKQGKNVLRDINDNYCCLGVLCDIYRKETGKMKWNMKNEVCFFPNNFGLQSLPRFVQQWAGLSDYDPMISYIINNVKHKKNLSDINDSGTSFKEIADMIEESL